MLKFVVAPRPRKQRGPMTLKSLKNKIARMGRMFPITSAVAGLRRPHDPRESCNIASITCVFVRIQIPIFTSWKQHINTPAHFEGLLHMLHVSHVSPLHGKHYRVALTHAFLACCWLAI